MSPPSNKQPEVQRNVPGPIEDARLPPHLLARKTIRGTIELRNRHEKQLRYSVGPVFLGFTLLCMYGFWKQASRLWSEPLLPLLCIIGWGLFSMGSWQVAEEEVMVVDHDLFEMQRSFLGIRRYSRSTASQIVLRQYTIDDIETFELRIGDAKYVPWSFFEGRGWTFNRPNYSEVLQLGTFLHEITGWPLIIPEQVRNKVTL